MKDTLLFLLTNIVDHPDEILIEETTTEGKTVFTIHTHQEDIGKVIGKQGRIIRALRDLVKVIAAKNNTFVDVVLAE